MNDIMTPEEANVKIMAVAQKKIDRYNEIWNNIEKLKKEKCYCDRATCSRCLQIGSYIGDARIILFS